MEIKKVLNLSKEEFDALVKAGEILSGVNKAVSEKEVDEISEGTTKLVTALKTVLDKIVQ